MGPPVSCNFSHTSRNDIVNCEFSLLLNTPFSTGPSSGTYVKVKFGAKKDGTLVAADLHLAYEAGAYAGGPIFLGAISSTSRYNIPNIQINGFDVIVNKPTMRPYRAPGAPQALFAVEQVIK